MAEIKDIRMFRSTAENTNGNPFPSGLVNVRLGCMLHRIAMKLRENGFSLGGFDHLYINLTTRAAGDPAPAKRAPDRYHPWYRFYDVPVSQEFYDALETPECLPRAAERFC